MKKRVLKSLIAAFMCMVVIVATSVSTFAAPYQVKRAKHSVCGTFNTSYGYKVHEYIYTDVASSGEDCKFCKKIVPEGEKHTYMYTDDVYYFMCSRCGDVYSVPYTQPIYAHYTNNVQDYYNYNNYK